MFSGYGNGELLLWPFLENGVCMFGDEGRWKPSSKEAVFLGGRKPPKPP